MAATQPTERSRVEWAEILDRIQTDLARALAQTPELAPPSSEPAIAPASMDALQGRTEFRACLDRADRCAADTDAVLHADAETIRLWTETVKQVREKLATWVTKAV
jgi:hypothetical protein